MKTFRAGVLVLAFVSLVLAPLYGQQASFSGSKPKKITVRPPAGKPFLSDLTPGRIERLISRLSVPEMLYFAEKKGLTSIEGKDITKMYASKAGRERALFSDRPVSNSDDIVEFGPSIAARPNNANIVVAAYWDVGNHLSYSRTSNDKGETWSDPKLLPARFTDDDVFNPVIRYAPNSAYLYAVYESRRSDNSVNDIVISRSTNNGATWSAPKVVFTSGDYDSDGYTDWVSSPSVDVHYFAGTSAANPYVFVTCTVLENDGGSRVLFRRSVNSASSLDAAAWELWATDDPGFVGGVKAIGGRSGDVLVTTFATDYYYETTYPFYIVSWSSTTNGASWANSASSWGNYYQLPIWLGPNESYGAWGRQGMFPQLTMTPGGVAYVAYAADPVEGSADTEDGDIYIIKSPRPYSTWSRPENLTEDVGGSQGYPAIGMKKTSNGTVVFVVYEDHSRSHVDNELYDIGLVYTGLAGGYVRTRVTDMSSTSSTIHLYGRPDCSASAVASDRVVHVIWQDRTDTNDIYDIETDIYCDLIELIW
jgi:hypothetical protein